MVVEAASIDSSDKSQIVVTWKDGHVSKYHVKWLRFHCHCDRCFRPFSGMYQLDTTKFPEAFFIKSSSIEGSDLQFTTDYEIFENHLGRFSFEWLRGHCNCDCCFDKFTAEREAGFDPSFLPEIQYKDIEGENGLFKLLELVVRSGFCVIQGIPNETGISVKIGERISPTLHALFKESSNYEEGQSNEGMVQDLSFYEVVPGFQLLYAQSDGSKGQTQLVDLIEAAETLRKESPDYFDALVKIPATFELKGSKSNQQVWFEMQKTHIEVDYFGKVVAVHWNPSLEGQLKIHQKDVMTYCKAHNAFAAILERKNRQVRIEVNPGELLIFNNHRMAHKHTGYSKAVQSYLHADDVKSKYVVLGHKLGLDAIPMKVGNRSSF